jgi:hypothetical protein
MQYYKVYYTDAKLPAGSVPDYSMILPLEFGAKDEALKEAFKLIFGGAVVWKIEGPEGFRLDRAEIEKQYQIFRVT